MRIEQQVEKPSATPVETKPKPGEKVADAPKVKPVESPPPDDLPQLPETD